MRLDFALVSGLALAGCSLSHPHYIAPDVHVGEPAFARSVEAHTLSSPVPGVARQLIAAFQRDLELRERSTTTGWGAA